MSNLFNMDINEIKHNGDTILLIMLNGDVIYEKTSRTIQYTVRNDGMGDYTLADYGLPCIYSDKANYSYNNYKSIAITKLDGTVTNDTLTKLSEIKKVKIYYSDTPIYSISFRPTEAESNPGVYYSAVTTVNYVNISDFISMNSMFRGCNNLSQLNVSNWDTSKVTDMEMMFSGSSLISIDVSNWNTSGVTNMHRMFAQSNISSLDVSNWNTHKVTDMSFMFAHCDLLTSLDVTSFNTANVRNMENMFSFCPLSSLDLSNFDTTGVGSMANMFMGCNKLTTLKLTNFNIDSSTNVKDMFCSCDNLKTLRLDNCNYTTIKKIIESERLPTSYIYKGRTIYCKEENAQGLEDLLPYGWRFNHDIEDSSGIPEEPEIPEIPTEPEIPTDIPIYVQNDFRDNPEITDAYTLVTDEHTNLSMMFDNCYSLTSVSTQYWDTSNVTNMRYMFTYCMSLITLDLSSFDTSKVTDMSSMFRGCSSLTTLDLSNFDMTKVKDMSDMLGNCKKLHTLRLDNCNKATISKIISSSNFPVNNYGTIYCNRNNSFGLSEPGNWEFSYID